MTIVTLVIERRICSCGNEWSVPNPHLLITHPLSRNSKVYTPLDGSVPHEAEQSIQYVTTSVARCLGCFHNHAPQQLDLLAPDDPTYILIDGRYKKITPRDVHNGDIPTPKPVPKSKQGALGLSHFAALIGMKSKPPAPPVSGPGQREAAAAILADIMKKGAK